MNLDEVTAARPLWSVTNATLLLDYPFIRLVDDAVDDLKAMQAGGQIDEQNWVSKGKGWICMLSGGAGHTPVITMEAWDAEPPSDVHECTRQRTILVRFPSGTLSLSGGADGGTEGPSMVLPDCESGRFNVRIEMQSAEPGRTAEELYLEYVDSGREDEELLYVEFWRLQFWPAT